MAIIGKLIKKTNEITFRRYQKKIKDEANQLQTLLALLQEAKKTRFGKEHLFDAILSSHKQVIAYQKNVPITDYDTFHDDWLVGSMEGIKDHTWPGRIRHYALSSGTTGSPSKRLPITNEMIRSFQKSSIKQFSMLHELDLSDKFYNGQILAVGGSSKLTKKENYLEGDLSGILKKYNTFLLSPMTKPGGKITKEKEWTVKLKMMVEKAPEWNISVIAGVPSWCILLMEQIIIHYGLKNIHEIWPNLEVYVHGGVFIEPYIPRLERSLGKKIHLLDTYLASEGYFAYQKVNSQKGMQLLLDAGIFFEFIPFNSEYFDSEGTLNDKHVAMTIDEVQPEIDYAIIVTTNAGLWRYLIGDLVRFTNIEQREIIITGRIKQYLSLCGEHLSLDNINQALEEVAREDKIEITEFTIYANENKLNHHWFIGANGANGSFNESKFMNRIDEKLCAMNDDYRCARQINLKDPDIKVIPVDRFYGFMASEAKLGAQNKFPRVMNKEQSENWLRFIN